MNLIEIDDQVYAELARRATGFNVTPNGVLRGILELPPTASAPATKPAQVQPPASPESSRSTLVEFIKNDSFQRHHQAIDRMLIILGWLHAVDPQRFVEAAIGFQRGKRLYFAKTEKEILQSGEGISAKPIPKSPLWVLTTLDNKSKRVVIEEILQTLGYPRDEIDAVIAEIPDSNIRRRHSKYSALLEHLVGDENACSKPGAA